jgi:hypothetical protein
MLELHDPAEAYLVPEIEKGKCCLTRWENEACGIEFGSLFRKKV